MSTVGFGNVNLVTQAEKSYCIAVMILGAFTGDTFFAAIFTTIVNAVDFRASFYVSSA